MKKLLSLAALSVALLFGSTTSVQAAPVETKVTQVVAPINTEATTAKVKEEDKAYVAIFTAETAASLSQRVNTTRLNEAEFISLIRQHKQQVQMGHDAQAEIQKAKLVKQQQAQQVTASVVNSTSTSSAAPVVAPKAKHKATTTLPFRSAKWVQGDRQKDLPTLPYKEDRD